MATPDSATEVKEFFNTYFTDKISYPANQVDAVVGFFNKRGFDETSASTVSVILLQQAKIDNVNVFKLLDTLKTLTDIQISTVVAEILNFNRAKTSSLGYKTAQTDNVDNRNIVV